MIRWTPTRPSPLAQRWQSREEILKAHLDSLSPDELREVRPAYYWLRFGQPAWLRKLAGKANFDPNQPRVPAGNPDGGQWTDAGGGQTAQPGRSDSTDFSAVRRRGPGDRGLLPFPHISPGSNASKPESPREPVTIVNNAQTGISTIDETTEKLKTILEKVVNTRQQGYGAEYGSAIHKDFADAVRTEES